MGTTYTSAISDLRAVLGDYVVLCDVSRCLDKSDGRSAWVEVDLRSPYAGNARKTQIIAWAKALLDLGWIADEENAAWLWISVDPDVPYDERSHATQPLSPLASLVVRVADDLTRSGTLSADTLAQVMDEAKGFGWRP